ncbi:polymer-forming cytoskeletal protein [Undibacterium sp. RuTC16W]|uniref:polymer-forming cytoskeletal protein n=1 Tax=Undibacterium sp. RuTC16W TaxID=3413048 RepID=UPI003BF0F913
MSKLIAPIPFQSKRLKRKQFASTGDVHIQGDLIIATQLLVGGDLLVDGDLEAEEVFCLGKLTVTGNIRVQSLYVGQALDCGGDIEVEFLLKTGCSAEWMARMLELDQAKASKDGSSYMDKFVHPAILQRDAHHEMFGGFGDIQALGYLACDVLDCHGSVQLDDVFDVIEVQYIGGHLSASEILIAGDGNCKGEVFSETDITVTGSLFAGNVTCQGNLETGAIISQSDISTWGSLRATGEISSLNGEIHAGRWIATKATIYAARYIKAGESVVAEKGITSGDDFGILAGTTLRRSLWPTQGFVSAPTKPRHLLSGKFVEDKKLKHIDALEKKRDTELDWEVVRRLKRESELA